MAREADRTFTKADELDWFMSALQYADNAQETDREIDRIALENYMVLPPGGDIGGADRRYMRGDKKPVLVDPETHVMVETLLSQMLITMIGSKGFVTTSPVGGEDAFASLLTGSLIERAWRLRTNFKAQYQMMKDAILFGTSVQAPVWHFQEGTRSRRVVETDPFTGEELSRVVETEEVLFDDTRFEVIDINDFFPDPSKDNIEDMMFCFRRIIVPQHTALEMVADGRWNKAAVDEAIRLSGNSNDRRDAAHGYATEDSSKQDDAWRYSIDRMRQDKLHESYSPLVGYECYAEVPYKHSDGARNRRLFALNGQLVESSPNPTGITRRIPYFEFQMNPIKGRFRGISPAAVARYSQDFASGIMMCLAQAVVRKTDAPIVFDKRLRPNMSALRRFRGPIPISGDPKGIREMEYNPQLGEAFALWQQVKVGMREQSGAQGGLSGSGFGSKRMSATETDALFSQQRTRPGVTALLWEREYYPALAQAVLEQQQLFIEDSTDLAKRVGSSVMRRAKGRSPFLGDIQGDFDIEFIGSSQMESKEVQLQFLERAFSVFGSVPGAAPLFPWGEAMAKWLELADLRELEFMVTKQDGVEDFLARQSIAGQSSSAASPPAAGNTQQFLGA